MDNCLFQRDYVSLMVSKEVIHLVSSHPAYILGGGIAVGTVLLVEQDCSTEFYLNLLKYFLA